MSREHAVRIDANEEVGDLIREDLAEAVRRVENVIDLGDRVVLDALRGRLPLDLRTTETPTLYSPPIGRTRRTLSAMATASVARSAASISALGTSVAAPGAGARAGAGVCAPEMLAVRIRTRDTLTAPFMRTTIQRPPMRTTPWKTSRRPTRAFDPSR
jgi:hypothetical protein